MLGPAILALALAGGPAAGTSPVAPVVSGTPGAPVAPGDLSVLVVVLDDVGTDQLAVYAEPPAPPETWPATPAIDALRAAGVLFTQFHVAPVCSATRAQLLTGRHGFRTGVHAAILPSGYALPDEEVLLPEYLRDAFPAGTDPGYARAAFGKWHLCGKHPANGCHPVRNGFQRFRGHLGNHGDHFQWEAVERVAPEVAGQPPCVAEWPGAATETAWDATVTRRDAASWMQAQPGPFFAYVAFAQAHSPIQVPPLAALPPATVQALAAEGLDQPGLVLPWTLPCDGPDPDHARRVRLVYRAMVEALDAELGLLLAAAPPDTMVFVLGDNGTGDFVRQVDVDAPARVGAPYPPFHAKGTIGLQGCRVPLIVAGPLAAPGGTCAGLVGGTDLFATVAAIAGAPPPTDPGVATDSVDFLPSILAPGRATARDHVLSELAPVNGHRFDAGAWSPSVPDPYSRALFDGRYRYVRVHAAGAALPCPVAAAPHCPRPTWTEQLHDVRRDPSELVNLVCAPDPEAAAALARLRAGMDALPCPCP